MRVIATHSIDQVPGAISIGAFLLLFPGFFFYHSGVGLGVFPPLLGGYFGVVSVGLAPFLWAVFLRDLLRNRKEYSVIDYLFFFISFFTCVVSIFNYIVSYAEYRNEALAKSVAGVLFVLNCYIIARTIPIHAIAFKVLSLACLLGMVLLVTVTAERGVFVLGLVAGEDMVSTYQGFARSLATTAIVGVSLTAPRVWSLFVFALGVIALFVIGARTEFVLFIVTAGGLTVALMRKDSRVGLGILFLCATSIVVISLFSEQMFAAIPKTRIFELDDILSGTSGLQRLEYQENALATIVSNPIFGGYGSYYKATGPGTYAHNLLSAWVDLGFVGFASYVLALLLVALEISRGWLLGRVTSLEYKLAASFGAFTIGALVFSKDYSYILFGLSSGFASRYAFYRKSVRGGSK